MRNAKIISTDLSEGIILTLVLAKVWKQCTLNRAITMTSDAIVHFLGLCGKQTKG